MKHSIKVTSNNYAKLTSWLIVGHDMLEKQFLS